MHKIDIPQPLIIETMSKWAKEQREKDSLPEGRHEFHGRLELQVDSIVTQRAGGLAKPTVALPIKLILAIALEKAGVQRHNISKLIQEACDEAQKLGETVTETMSDIDQAMKDRIDFLIRDLPKIKRAGACMVDASIEIVKFVPTELVVQKVGK